MQVKMPNQGKDLMAQNSVKIEEARSASLTSSIYKRGVPSALPCLCPLEDCGKVICRPRDLLSHIQSIHKLRHMFWCYQCDIFFPHPSDLERHGFYVHKIPEWTKSLSSKIYTLGHSPPPFNAKKYFQSLSKADKTSAPYPKVAKKRRGSIVSRNGEKKVALSGSPAEIPTASTHVVAKRSLPIPVDVQPDLGISFEAATIDELLEGN